MLDNCKNLWPSQNIWALTSLKMRKTWTYLSLCKQAVQCQHHYHPVKIQIVTQYWTKWRTSLKNPREKWTCTIFASKVKLITSFSLFLNLRIYEFFPWNFICFGFLQSRSLLCNEKKKCQYNHHFRKRHFVAL